MIESFPIEEVIHEVKKHLSQSSLVVLQAPPGAGKSTVLPVHLMDEPWLEGKKILMLEPRRLAAKAVAGRLAELKKDTVGNLIGYKVRFENRTSKQTRLEVLTEGILTRLIQADNSLEEVGLVIFDEFHERSLDADLAFVLCRQIQQILRPDIRILIMSAKLSSILGNAPLIVSEGRQHPVSIRYLNSDSDKSLESRIMQATRQAFSENKGDILVFLPGAGEIQRTAALLEEQNPGAVIHLLYGDLPLNKQQEALLPDSSGRRKIILSTSIAETSLTIEGITVVVDSGYARVPRFDPGSGLTRLETVRVTKDAADQRAGRAGRLGPGVCYRLWNEGIHQNLIPHRNPEILEADLSSMLLELSQWGVKDINELDWITQPPRGAVGQAREVLQKLEAFENNQITAKGKEMLRLPTHPRIAHMLFEAATSEKDRNRELALACDIASLLEERDPLPRETGADFTLRLEVLRKWRTRERVNADRNVLERIERMARSWRQIFKIEEDNSIISDTEAGKLIAAAYPERIARLVDAKNLRYRLANGRIVRLSPHDSLHVAEWLAIAHLDQGANEGKVYLASPLDPEDIMDLAEEREMINWDKQKGMFIAVKEKHIGNITISSRPLENVPSAERIRVLCEVIKQEGLKMLGWGEEHALWQARVLSVRKWRPEEDWPDVSDQQLLENIEDWLSPYLENVYKQSDLNRLDLYSIIISMLPYDKQQRLDQLAPTKIKVPSGFMIPLRYFSDGSTPELSVRLQEVFGLLETPTVNEGRVKILLHLLSPGYKPVQVTQDLKSFWANTYPVVRKEFRVRYQKYHWPEDPWTAEAVRGTKKNLKNGA